MPLLQDASGFSGTPERIFEPATEADLAEILLDAARNGTPVTLAGALTGLGGGGVPEAGWAVSLRRFNRVEIRGQQAIAGAGATLQDVQSAGRRQRMFYPPDPTEQTASVGGSLATNASGSRSFLYGATRRHVAAVRALFLDGSLRELRNGDTLPFDVPEVRMPATTKHSAGYPLRPGMDWLDLLIGSEGTLAVITEAALNLLPVPESLLTGVLFFSDEAAALEAVEAFRDGRKLRMLEYIDGSGLDLLRPEWAHIPDRGGAALLVEEETGPDAADAWLDCAGDGLIDSWIAAGDRDRERFRRFRHALPEAVNARIRAAGLLKVGTDFAVPVQQNAAMLRAYRDTLEPGFRGRYVIFGHIGDAHLHVNVLPANEFEAALARDLVAALAREAVAFGGTVAAEHGIGKRKRHLLPIQYDRSEIDAMKAVKTRLDPQWLLGRGTLFDR